MLFRFRDVGLRSCGVMTFARLFCFGWLAVVGCRTSDQQPEEGPSPPKSPKDERETFQLEPGLTIELIAAEPMVQDPVVMSFDEDGRLWVVEMRGFMSDIDGTHEKDPVGRVSILEDTDGNGEMDKSTVYLDSLVMPRALAVVAGGALIAENEALWLTQDVDHDLQADSKVLIDSTYAGSPFPEHSGNGLWRGIDNWYYNAKSRFRYKLIGGSWQRDSTEFRGQWGISHDDQGRLFYNYNWSQLHADLVPPNYFYRNKNHIPTTGIDHGLTIDRKVFPIRANPAVNRGYIPGTLDSEGRLLEFTAACSPFVLRSTNWPNGYYGNVFVCEPSGNLVKRNVIEEDSLILSAHDPHPGKEFLASTDERFRPVFLASGPDGSLFLADMYRGLIQHGAYVTPYLREQTLSRKLVQPVHYGRIWRIASENGERARPEKISAYSSQQLVELLSLPNGWHRDMAQRLLVERNDTSVQSALTEMIRAGRNELAVVHALWTLEGLDLLRAELLLPLLTSSSSLISSTSLRLLENFVRQDERVKTLVEEELLATAQKATMALSLQIAFTAELLSPAVSNQLLEGIAASYVSSPLFRDAIMSSLEGRESDFLRQVWASALLEKPHASKEIFIEMLTISALKGGKPVDAVALLALIARERELTWKEQAVLSAFVTQGTANTKPIRLPAPPALLHSALLDEKQKTALSNLLEWPGHVVEKNNTTGVGALNEKELEQFTLGRQHYLTSCSGCHGRDGAGMKRLAPTLINSEWVLGNEKRLALLVLHGLEGPIRVNGKMYDIPEILPVMPAHSTLTDGAIAGILTYIRNEWGNRAGAVSGRLVGSTRHTTQGRVVPWTPEDLDKHMETLTADEK